MIGRVVVAAAGAWRGARLTFKPHAVRSDDGDHHLRDGHDLPIAARWVRTRNRSVFVQCRCVRHRSWYEQQRVWRFIDTDDGKRLMALLPHLWIVPLAMIVWVAGIW